jgi:HEPN domain-containing protein
MNDRRSHARQWLAKAESDRLAAERLLGQGGPYDAVCFHAQQAAEKALKALLALADAPIARTHNLEDLQAACLAVSSTAGFGALDDVKATDLSNLTPFAVESRYDAEFWPEESTAREAVAVATRVVSQVRRLVDS